MADEEVFPGFWHPDVYEVGFTRLPHELIEEMHKMSDCELRVVLYIFRHTWGFQEIDNEISKNKLGRGKKLTTDEFVNGRKPGSTRMDGGTGLSDRGVKNGITQALECQFSGYFSPFSDKISLHDRALAVKAADFLA